MANLFYQGHGSYRMVSKNGILIYVDPFAGVGYNLNAKIIGATHTIPIHINRRLV